MVKLSELPMDAYLTVGHTDIGEMRIISKEDFLNDACFLDSLIYPCPEVTLAEKTYCDFDLNWIIEMIGDGETYEDWQEDVLNDIMNSPETEPFIKMVKEVFKRHPTYWEGQLVDIDMNPKEL